MAKYVVEFLPRVHRDMRKVPTKYRSTLQRLIAALTNEPYPSGTK